MFLLFKYKGVNKKGKYARGFINAESVQDAISDLKNEYNLSVIVYLKETIDNVFINKIRSHIEERIETLENNLIGTKKEKKEKKLTKIRKKKKNVFTKTEKNLNNMFLNLQNKFLKRRQILKMNKEAYRRFSDNVFIELDKEDSSLSNLNNLNNPNNNHDKLTDEELLHEDFKQSFLNNLTTNQNNIDTGNKIDWELIGDGDDLTVAKKLNVKIKESEILLFTRRLQIMLSSGISLIDSLLVLKNTSGEDFSKILTEIIEDIELGNSFSQALSKFPDHFDHIYVALVSVGEKTGNLETSLLDIIKLKEQEIKVKKKVKTASIYPTIVGFVLIAIMTLGALFFIPTFREMFAEQGVQLPLLTRFIFRVSDIFPYFVGITTLIVIIFNFLKENNEIVYRKYRLFRDKFILKCPVVKDVANMSYMYSFSSTVASMLKNGIRLKDTLKLASRTIDNVYIKNEIMNASSLMVNGLTFSEALSKQEYFDDILVNIVLTGEESGQMSFSLAKIAEYYNNELDRQISNLMELVQPISIIIIAIFVVPVIIGIYLPVIEISSGQLLDT